MSFIISGAVIAALKHPARPAAGGGEGNALKVVWDGWRYVSGTPMVRGLIIGIVGAFAAGGVVIGLARTFVADLGGGEPGTASCSGRSSSASAPACGWARGCCRGCRAGGCSASR